MWTTLSMNTPWLHRSEIHLGLWTRNTGLDAFVAQDYDACMRFGHA
jgi:hypothetical protein